MHALRKDLLANKLIGQRIRMDIRMLLARNKGTIEGAIAMVGRKRERMWLMDLLAHVSDKPIDEALETATRMNFPSLAEADSNRVMKKSLELMRKPDICVALEGAYEARGFSMGEAIDMHIGHIRGTHTRTQVTKSGETIEVPIPPSYMALQGYQKLVLPQQTQKVQVAHTNVNELIRHAMDEEDASDQTFEHRVIGELIDTDPGLDPDDVDPFEGIDPQDDADDADDADDEDEDDDDEDDEEEALGERPLPERASNPEELLHARGHSA